MSTEKLQRIDNFISDYRSLLAQDNDQVVDQFTEHFSHFKTEFQRIRDLARQEALHLAPEFNVFQVLGLDRYENRTHSAFLANLLDPHGSHGQRFLFLETFLHHLSQRYDDFPMPLGKITAAKWRIRTEHTHGVDRLDIVISCPELGFISVIENKIDASEQYRQIVRYASWLDKQEAEFQSRSLLFLTPLGRQATTDYGADYFPISYRQDISKWLELAMVEIQAAPVREVVQQYLTLINRI